MLAAVPVSLRTQLQIDIDSGLMLGVRQTASPNMTRARGRSRLI
jgi:hypothetical protein